MVADRKERRVVVHGKTHGWWLKTLLCFPGMQRGSLESIVLKNISPRPRRSLRKTTKNGTQSHRRTEEKRKGPYGIRLQADWLGVGRGPSPPIPCFCAPLLRNGSSVCTERIGYRGSPLRRSHQYAAQYYSRKIERLNIPSYVYLYRSRKGFHTHTHKKGKKVLSGPFKLWAPPIATAVSLSVCALARRRG